MILCRRLALVRIIARLYSMDVSGYELRLDIISHRPSFDRLTCDSTSTVVEESFDRKLISKISGAFLLSTINLHSQSSRVSI